MSEKPDYYQILGVDKKATKADIQSAYKKIAMKNHPDMVKMKPWTPEQKEAANQLFKDATEAEGILTDDLKRSTYDQYGHKGLENISSGKSPKSGQTYTDAAGQRMKRGPFTEDDTFSFFEKRAERPTTSTADDGLSPEERRERARQERLARRKNGDSGSSTTPSVREPFDNTSSANVFKDVADKVTVAADALKGGVTVPFEVLEKFRDNLQDFVREVDKAIARSRPSGPKHP